jgi:hypothetical protein
MTPVNKLSDRLRGRYLHCTQETQETGLHALSGIRTRSPSNQAAANLRLRQDGYRDRRNICCFTNFVTFLLRFLILLNGILCDFCVMNKNAPVTT